MPPQCISQEGYHPQDPYKLCVGPRGTKGSQRAARLEQPQAGGFVAAADGVQDKVKRLFD